MSPADTQIQYANWLSKLLFAKSFEEQFIIPVPRSSLEYAILRGIEKIFFGRAYQGQRIDRPIFILGLPRSGTTLLYNLICAHESAAYITNCMNAYPHSPMTIEWMRKFFHLNIKGERFLQDSIITDFGSPSEPIMFWGNWVQRTEEDLVWPRLRKSDLTPAQITRIETDIRKIMATFGRENARFVCKYPVFQSEVHLLKDLFPDARFIHIVRDGRMVANSLVKLYDLINGQIIKINHPTVQHLVPYPRVPKLPEYIEKYGERDLRCTSHVWADAIQMVEDAKPAIGPVLEIKYEDLVASPGPEMRRIFQFCELPYPAAGNTEYSGHFSSIGRLSHKNSYSGFEVVEREVPEMLKKWGYT